MTDGCWLDVIQRVHGCHEEMMRGCSEEQVQCLVLRSCSICALFVALLFARWLILMSLCWICVIICACVPICGYSYILLCLLPIIMAKVCVNLFFVLGFLLLSPVMRVRSQSGPNSETLNRIVLRSMACWHWTTQPVWQLLSSELSGQLAWPSDLARCWRRR